MSDQPITPTTPSDDLTDEQQRTMDGVEHSIDDAKKAEADLRAMAPGAMTLPEDEPVPDARDSEA
ncbi:hypothetical protein V3N99_11160 [Dermatophilaceae bacterium Soc4.6]